MKSLVLQYAVESQIQLHGLDVESSMLLVHPRKVCFTHLFPYFTSKTIICASSCQKPSDFSFYFKDLSEIKKVTQQYGILLVGVWISVMQVPREIHLKAFITMPVSSLITDWDR